MKRSDFLKTLAIAPVALLAINAIGKDSFIVTQPEVAKIPKFEMPPIPRGYLVYWKGDNVPEGWFECDGQNGTPDLRTIPFSENLLKNPENHVRFLPPYVNIKIIMKA